MAAGIHRWRTVGDGHRNCIRLVLFFAFSFAVYNWIYDYVIVAQSETTICFFMFDRQFLLEFLDHPGGLLRYAGRFLGQLYHYKWLGALVISTCIISFGALFHLVLTRLEHTARVLHALVPCILLLALHASPNCPIEYTVGLLMSCSVFLGYVSLRTAASRQVYASLATPALYLVVGGHVWFFAVWVTVLEWLDGRRRSSRAFRILYPALALCMPLAAYRWLFPMSLRSAFVDAAFLSVSRSFLGFVFSGYLLLVPFWVRLWSAAVALPLLSGFVRQKNGSGAAGASFRRSPSELLVSLARRGWIIVLAVFLLWIRYDPESKELLRYRELYKGKEWDAILDRAKRSPSHALMVQFFTDCALSHKGQLLEQMFHYPQTWGPRGLVLNFSGIKVSGPAADDTVRAMYSSDLFFEMGHVNAAFRQAYNQMAAMGRTYDNLERIAECNIVNENYALAEKYLNMLHRTLFHRGFAEHCRTVIADSSAVDTRFAELRTRLPTVDRPIGLGERGILEALVDSNPHNRMALDYLTAWLLLDKMSIEGIADALPQLMEAGYTSVPTHCQEALVLLEKWAGRALDTHGLEYDGETASRFTGFLEGMSSYARKESTQRELEAAFGNTYMYYYFHVTPAPDNRVRVPR